MEEKHQLQIQEDGIDFSRLVAIANMNKKRFGGIIVGCTIVSLCIALILPKKYESTTLVQTRNTVQNSVSEMSNMMKNLSLQEGYVELMKSRRVLEPIINEMEWDDEESKPEASDFAKQYLEIENTKKTDLITITAKGKSPEEAQKISRSVADNFLSLQTDMNQQTQSLLVKFLENRIEEAKKDTEEARTKFARYQQEHKVYSPDEQAKAAVAKMAAFDEAIGNMQVQEKANQAKLEAVESKLDEINYKSETYNINDNNNVMNLRQQIVDAEVKLVELREKYTDENPSVISIQEKIAKLHKKLSEEVNAMVSSKYTTLNPTQAAMVADQANAQVSIEVVKASEAALQKRRAEKEKELENFPENVLEYMALQRETKIKEQIYTDLIKQAEEKKIKEAMESMDIQIIDEASLPKKACFPKKSIFMLVGFFLGLLISLVLILKTYIKEL